MRIAALATDGRREEIGKKKIPPQNEWVWVESIDGFEKEENTDVFFDFEFEPDRYRLEKLAALRGTVFVNAVTDTLAAIGHPFIRFNAWPGFFSGDCLEVVAPSEPGKIAATKILDVLGWKHCWVPDTAGMVSPRIVSMIINEAYFTWGEGISTKEEIDIAMKLGTNYPRGPFEWSRNIGLKNIYELLMELGKSDRVYELAPALVEEWKKAVQQKK